MGAGKGGGTWARACFSIPTAYECNKFKQIQILQAGCKFPTSSECPTIQPAFIEWQTIIRWLPPLPIILGQKSQKQPKSNSVRATNEWWAKIQILTNVWSVNMLDKIQTLFLIRIMSIFLKYKLSLKFNLLVWCPFYSFSSLFQRFPLVNLFTDASVLFLAHTFVHLFILLFF